MFTKERVAPEANFCIIELTFAWPMAPNEGYPLQQTGHIYGRGELWRNTAHHVCGVL
jgi:hypothetical protein